MSGSHTPLSSTIKLVAAANSPTASVDSPSGSVIVSTESETTVKLTNTTSTTPRMLVPAVLIPSGDLGSPYTQFIPSGTPKGQSVGSPGNYQPLIISGMNSGAQQSPSSVFSILKPVITQVKEKPPKSGSPTVLQNTKIVSSPQTTTLVLPQTQKFKLLAKGPPQEVSTSGTGAVPPLKPITTQTFINFNKLKHMSGINPFKRVQQAFPLDPNDSILKVRLKHGNVINIESGAGQSTEVPQCIDLEEVETTPTVESPAKAPEPTHVTATESQPDYININFTTMKDYVNEFPQLITIHGLTSEKSESEPETVTVETTTETVVEEPAPVPSLEPVEEPPETETVVTTEVEEKVEEPNPEPAAESMEVQSVPAEDTTAAAAAASETPEEKVAETTEKTTEEKVESSQESETAEKTEDAGKIAADNASALEKLEEELLNLKKKRQFKRPSILGSRKKSMPPANTLLTNKTKPAGESDDKEKSTEDGTSISSGEAKESRVSDTLEMPPIDEKSMKPVSKDFDPSKLLDWQDGVGVLPGSDLKFKMNDLGILEYINAEDGETNDSSQKEPVAVAKKEEKKVEPTKKRARKEKLSPDDIYCCENCGCYGMACEFKSQRFCSETCEEAAAKRRAAISRRAIELEEMKLKRKRRRQMLELQHQKEKEALLQKTQLEESMRDDKSTTGTPEVATPSCQPAESMEQLEIATPADTGTPMSTAHNSPVPSPHFSDNEHEQQEQDQESKQSESPTSPLQPWEYIDSDKTLQFSWPKYLEHVKGRAAPSKLFSDHGFPYQRNGFRHGMRLEGIDPRMPSEFCSYSVADVRGYRIRLHYEGWPDSHDFWLNADSKDIFLIGFCEKTGRPLNPPRGYTRSSFNWAPYLKLLRAQSAPRHLFLHQSCSKISVGPSGFRVGMKLEAIDKHNPELICVATVADIIDGRILVHFDSWDRMYDYWAEPSSHYIHPVGWCEQNKHTLTPPKGYTNFSWDSYLKETKATAVPSRAFKPKPAPPFKKGMKLECVDPRFPENIRVATINEVKEHRLHISFDGWPIEAAVWVDADSPDIHPMGWCSKTGYYLTGPPRPNKEHACLTQGCRALLKNSQFILPHSTGSCPLATVNLNKIKKGASHRLPFSHSTKDETQPKNKPENSELEGLNEKFDKCESPVAKKRKIELAPPPTDKALKLLRTDVHESVFNPGYSPSPEEPQINWTKHAELLNIDPGKVQNQKPVRTWSPSHVEQFVQGLPGCSDRSKIFLQEKIDGQALLMLSQSDLINMLGFKVGPAIKLYSSISILRQAQAAAE